MSNMLDLQQALGGAGGGPPGGGPASINVPSMADEAAGGAPGAGGDTDQGGGGDQFGSTMDALDAAESALHYFIQNDPDDADKAKATTALKVILDLKAGNSQSAQAGDMKSLQRALQGAGAGGPGA